MSTTTKPTVKPEVAPSKPELPVTDTKSNTMIVSETSANSNAGHSSSPVPQPQSTGIVGYLVWGFIFAAAGVAWYYHAAWWPTVATTLGMAQKPTTKPPPRPVPVLTAPVVQKDMQIFINGLGTVTAFKTVTVRSRVEGELVKVAFTEGQMIREGDLLAEIDRRPFDVQLQQAEGQLARDEATLASAEETLHRYQELLTSKAITAQQNDEQKALVKQTVGAIQSDRAQVANAKLQLDYCHIVAPIGGRIGLRLVDQGNIVRANDPSGLAVITQLQPIALVFTIPQDDISRVQKALVDNHELTVLAFDRNFKTKLATGKLLAIDNQVDATTGTVRLKAEFSNEDGLLFPNQFVNARLLVDVRKNAVVVPTAAVQRGPSSMFVYVVTDKETVDQKNVTVGISEGAETVIESGLNPGETVVTDGLDKLTKDAPVTINKKQKEGKEKPRTDQEPTKEPEHSKSPETRPESSKSTSKKVSP